MKLTKPNTIHFLYRKKLYKNNETEIAKNKKQIKNFKNKTSKKFSDTNAVSAMVGIRKKSSNLEFWFFLKSKQ